jgi:hypothetical protein
VIITLAAGLRGGSLEIARHAREAGKRCIHLSQADRFDSSAALRGFAKAEAVRILNVAGSRKGEEPGIYKFTQTPLGRPSVLPRNGAVFAQFGQANRDRTLNVLGLSIDRQKVEPSLNGFRHCTHCTRIATDGKGASPTSIVSGSV